MYNTIKHSLMDKKARHIKALQVFLFIVMTTSTLIRASNAYAENSFPVEFRVGESFGRVDDVELYAIAIPILPIRRLRAHRMEFAAGSFSSTLEDRPFVSFGAVWRMPSKWLPALSENTFVDFGFSPTYIAGSNFNGKDVGGNLHFTSSLSVGKYLNRQRTLALSFRAQHTSNGGLDRTNPGLDLIGLNLTFYPNNY